MDDVSTTLGAMLRQVAAVWDDFLGLPIEASGAIVAVFAVFAYVAIKARR